MANGAFNLEEFVRILDSWGLTDVLLPFLLFFVVIFAIMEKANVLGKDKKKYNLVFALVVALLVVIPHVLNIYPPERDIVQITNNSLPQVSIIAVAVVMVLILIGLFGGEAKWAGNTVSGWIAVVAFVIVLLIFGGAAGWWKNWSWFENFFGKETVAIIVMLLVFAIIVWWVTSDDKDSGQNSMGKFGQSMSELFGGGGGKGGGGH